MKNSGIIDYNRGLCNHILVSVIIYFKNMKHIFLDTYGNYKSYRHDIYYMYVLCLAILSP